MDIQEIKLLLEQYYEGKTTLEEEEKLKAFFAKNTIPEDLKAEQVSFRFFQSAQEEKIASEKISIRRFTSRNTKVIALNLHVRRAVAVAASIAVLSSIFFLNQGPKNNKHITYNESNESQMAYLETKKALLLVSQKLNKGTKNLDKISKIYEVQELLTTKK